MCGIVGYVGKRDAVPFLLGGLRRLEYRGYDSAGIAVMGRSELKVHKAAGKLRQLETTLPKRLKGQAGIGHTRWATHGAPTDGNAHPHVDCSGRLAVVHNGIIENADRLRARLEGLGHTFTSETDTEVLAHLIEEAEGTLEQKVRQALSQVRGTYGIVVVHADAPDQIVAARNGSPVVLGLGEKEMFVASDVSAVVGHTQQVVYLDDGELAVLDAGGFRTATLDAQPTQKTPTTVTHTSEAYDRNGHPHYMLKEILEQPQACERTLLGRVDTRFHTAHLGGLNMSARDLLDVRRIKILGCGSAYYAGLAGAHLIEELARIPAAAEPASEFRYRNPVIERDCLYLAVSQSGETADTLEALREVQRKGGRVLGVVNAVGSTIARECGGGIYIHAGPEVCVASTKTFTCTTVAFALLAIYLGRVRDLSPAEGAKLTVALQQLPAQIQTILDGAEAIRVSVSRYVDAAHVFFIGRAGGVPVALEGAQKLKEISYVHAQAYPAAELKHGPLALVSEGTPIVAVVPRDEFYEKTLNTIAEVRARGGRVIAVTHAGDERLASIAEDIFTVPATHPALNSILLNIPLQLFAYYFAAALGRDIDQPRNLAKSVTVE